jgi:4-diphosphocytidyl-2-C-methyl-D-erythritol kinase
MTSTRRARVRALAKINLDLRVLARRADGFHELRTIFQTISLADTIEIAFTPARQTSIELADDLHLADNLVTRAARLVMEAMRATGRVEMWLRKRIPLGAGLGGGSSDAAAVLLALPVLARRHIPLANLVQLGHELGSDVPFFLLGGAAVGIGRGTELFPLPDQRPQSGVLVSPSIHVSTPDAYRRLSARLTSESLENKIFSFQSHAWDVGVPKAAANDFETVVFELHEEIAAFKQQLLRAGASTAMMTGSGSAVFGLFGDGKQASRAVRSWGEVGTGEVKVFGFSLVSRARYRSLWWRALAGHITEKAWPPQSRNIR